MHTEESLNQTLSGIIETLPTRSKIFLPTNKVPLQKQIDGLENVQRLYTGESQAFYSERMQNLKTGLSGRKRCFIIGNGPSLNKTDLSLLKNEITFAVNGFFLKAESLNWSPTFYVVEDHLVAEDRAENIKSFKGPIKFFPIYLGYCLPEADDTIFYNHRPRVSYPDGFDFSLNADKITYAGCTVTFSALQLAAYFGFTEIYLIGVDADYEIPKEIRLDEEYDTSVLDMDTDDPNHFHPDYFGKGYRWHDPQVDKMVEAYSEARKVCDANGISISNATIGGKLEVFKRVEYSSLFMPKASDPVKDNRQNSTKLLLIDFTRMGHQTATGELKEAYLGEWSNNRLLHLYGEAGPQFGISTSEADSGNSLSQDEVISQINKFQPELILYRPVENRPDLHALGMRLISELKRPYIIWLMDDWPRSLAISKPAAARLMDSDIARLCRHANRCLAISAPMAGAFGARYGHDFDVFHNSVDRDIWDSITPNSSPKETCIVRYSGNLAPHLTLDPLLELAKTIESVSGDLNIQLEIHTQAHWQKTTAHHFADFAKTKVEVTSLDKSEYYQWLAEADILFIGNSFGEDAKHYLQYSFANKIVEYLASSRPIIAYGPGGLFSMDFLETSPGVLRVRKPSNSALKSAIVSLVKSPENRNALGQENRDFAFSKFELRAAQQDFFDMVSKTAEENFKNFTLHKKQKHRVPSLQNSRLGRDFLRGIRFVKRKFQ